MNLKLFREVIKMRRSALGDRFKGFYALFLLGQSAIPSLALACTCIWSGPFLKVAPSTALIVRAKVIDYYGESRGISLAMDVEVIEVLSGSNDLRQIRIWGDNGSQCRPYVSAFPEGTEWIFAVSPSKNERESGGFALSACGEYWVKVENSMITGRIAGSNFPRADQKPDQMELEVFKGALSQAISAKLDG